MKTTEITNKELISQLQELNPDATMVINIQGERYPITGIWSWSAIDGESYNTPREEVKAKTPRITLATTLSGDLEEIEANRYTQVENKVYSVFKDELGYDVTGASLLWEELDLNLTHVWFSIIFSKIVKEFQIDLEHTENLVDFEKVEDVIRWVYEVTE